MVFGHKAGMFRTLFPIATALAFALALSACESMGIAPDPPPPTEDRSSSSSSNGGLIDTLFGSDAPTGGGSGIGVNSFLWRASLDTISFMPLNSADPFGGVIITDWYSPEGARQERFKMNVFILVRSLRADGVRVSLFRQVQDRGRIWRDASVPVQTASRIEDAILTRARQLRSKFLRR